MKTAIFEGPLVKNPRGWRSYMTMFIPAGGGPTVTRSCLSTRTGAERLAQLFHAQLFDFGTWENGAYDRDAMSFPVPLPAILEELGAKNTQKEFRL